MKVVVLGTRGMLAHAVIQAFIKTGIDVHVAGRKPSPLLGFSKWTYLNALEYQLLNFNSFDVIINCIGVIKPEIDKNNAASIRNAITINSVFPHVLSAHNPDVPIIQIATDCVFNGLNGLYDEDSEHDAIDIYGKTKSLGEVRARNFHNLRTSIIGREVFGQKSLVSWFLSHGPEAMVPGFCNHFWNGITIDAFANICVGMVRHEMLESSNVHIVPANTISKYNLLKLFNQRFRTNYTIKEVETEKVDRTLTTKQHGYVEYLWNNAGYSKTPTIEDLVEKL